MQQNINIRYSNDSVAIIDSHRISDADTMTCTVKLILADKRCPACVAKRSARCLVREWQAHNLLYDLGLFRTHTATVDLDAKRWYDFAYHVVGAIYNILHL